MASGASAFCTTVSTAFLWFRASAQLGFATCSVSAWWRPGGIERRAGDVSLWYDEVTLTPFDRFFVRPLLVAALVAPILKGAAASRAVNHRAQAQHRQQRYTRCRQVPPGTFLHEVSIPFKSSESQRQDVNESVSLPRLVHKSRPRGGVRNARRIRPGGAE